MDAKTFFESHEKAELERVAKAAGTNFKYLYQIARGIRSPSPKLARRLVEASGGKMTLEKLRPDIYGGAAA